MTIELAKTRYSKEELLNLLDPAVAKWFFSTFPELTPPQQLAIASIQSRRNTLIASPTGSGKTLGAFLSIISELASLSRFGSLEDRVYCVYVSPLRALNNDISKNIKQPIEEIAEILKKQYSADCDRVLQVIRVAVRTSDTSQADRSKMLRKPPHILITTPETLAILLVAPKFRENLRKVRWVVVDEIHELCSSKRGVHLSLSLERLQELCEDEFTRVGLSATINPLKDVASYLVGFGREGKERECLVVDARFSRKTELEVRCPLPDLVHSTYDAISSKMYEGLKSLVADNRTTLIFANTRSWSEKIAYQLSRLNVAADGELSVHHSSLSKELRKDVEDRLKEGKIKVVTTSTSLELGVDMGSVDLVVQVGSPKSISRCLQRVGRSGHSLDRTSKAVLVAFDRDDLIEDTVISSEIRRGSLDETYIPKNALDVLAQQIVGMSIEKSWAVQEAFDLVRRSYCYHGLDIDSFRRVLRYLAGGYGLAMFRIFGRIWYDENSDHFGKKGWMTRVIYSTNIGTIPDEVAVSVITRGDKKWVGEIQEEFLERLVPGDIFLLGGKTFKFSYAKGFKAYVDPIEQGRPTVPVWTSEALPLSFQLGEAIARFRSDIFWMLYSGTPEQEIENFVSSETGCDGSAVSAIIAYLKTQANFLAYCGVLEPQSQNTILLENFVDSECKQNLIFSCTFGRRVNDALGRVVGHRISEKRGGSILVTVSDSGFMITLRSGIYVQPSVALSCLSSEGFRESLATAVRRSEMVRRRFRHCCGRALMILRNYKGNVISVQRQQVSSQIMLGLCERLDRFPVLEEAYREVMEDLMDVRTAERIVGEVERGIRRITVCPRQDFASPFAHNLLVRGCSDLMASAERRDMLRSLYDTTIARIRGSGSRDVDHDNRSELSHTGI